MARARSPISVRNGMVARVQGLDVMERRLARLPAQLKANLEKALNRGADTMVATMKSIAPREEGDFLASIHKEAGDHALSVKVVAGSEATPGPPLEYGHMAPDGTHVQPRPSFWPSYRVTKKKMVGGINRAGSAAIKAITGPVKP